MTKDYFIKSASLIKLPDKRFVYEYSAKKDELVSHVNRTLLNRTDLEKLIGQDNKDMMMNNHYNHALFMESVMLVFSPNIFVETILWVFKVYRAHGFKDLYWSAQLDAWLDAMKTHLSEEAFHAIEPLYVWIIVNLPSMLDFGQENKIQKCGLV